MCPLLSQTFGPEDMTRPTVYLETTVIGHLVGRMHLDPVIAGRQTVTRAWWASAEQNYHLLVSQLVAEECGSGDSEAASERLAVLEKLTFLDASDESNALSRALMAAGAIPSTEPRDALHVAIAATNGVQFLVTWNFKHIANAVMRDFIEKVCRDCGYEPPTICTPDELYGDSDGP